MRKKVNLITVEQAMRDAFFSGLQLGFSLGGFGAGVSANLVGRSKKEVEGILQKEIDLIFKHPKGTKIGG